MAKSSFLFVYFLEQTTIDDTMKEKVVVVADTACQGLNELCDKHQEEVDKTKDDVLNLQSDLRNITSRAPQA